MMEKTTENELKKDESGMEKEEEKEKKKKGFDKELVLKKMEKFLKSVQPKKDENKETETSYSRRNDRSERNRSKRDRTDTHESSISRSLSSEKRNNYRRERTRTISRSVSRERRHHKLREISDDSSRIHHRRRVKRKIREDGKENETGKDKSKHNHERIDRYVEYDQHEHYDRRKRREHMYRNDSPPNAPNRQEHGRRDQRNDKRKSASFLLDRYENDKYTYKERKIYNGDCSPGDRKKESKRTKHGSESRQRNSSKYVINKSTGEKIETKFFHVPLGFHTTKEKWESYTKWLKRKNKYRFDIPFDQYKIYRRSSSLSPNTWEEFVHDSEENETEEEALKKDTARKGRHKGEEKKSKGWDKEYADTERKEKHKKERKENRRKYKEDEDTARKEKHKKERNRGKKGNSEEENTGSSLESYDSLTSVIETKKSKRKEKVKKRKEKKHDHKKKVSKDKKDKRRKRRKESESKKRKTIKEKHIRKGSMDENSPNLDNESISSSVTSVSFLNEETELEEEALVKGTVAKEDKTKDSVKRGTSVKDENRKSVSIEREAEKEHFCKPTERNLVNKANELKKRETEKNDLKDNEDEEQMSDNESDIGPTPLDINVKLANKQINYGVAMMPGEGEAIAQFVQKGKRIPRRGEVGLSAEAIENYEKLGYVMSGSRHKRMNAIRMRKENQVYSVEEQRALAMYNYEERALRENALINDLREILRKQNEAIMKESQNESE